MSLDELCQERLGISEAEARRNIDRLNCIYRIEKLTLEALYYEARGMEDDMLFYCNSVTQYRKELAEL